MESFDLVSETNIVGGNVNFSGKLIWRIEKDNYFSG